MSNMIERTLTILRSSSSLKKTITSLSTMEVGKEKEKEKEKKEEKEGMEEEEESFLSKFDKKRTEKGAIAFSTTKDPHLDFFAGVLRGTNDDKIAEMLPSAWKKSPKKTLQLLAHLRDRDGGKGEKTVSYYALLWLREHHPLTYVSNLELFINLGYIKDLLQLVRLSEDKKIPILSPQGNVKGAQPVELCLLAEMLRKDSLLLAKKKQLAEKEEKEEKEETEEKKSEIVEDGKAIKEKKEKKQEKKESISLAGKWAPSEKASDKFVIQLAKRVARLVFGNKDKKAFQKYRLLLSALRKETHVVERDMCLKQWSSINFAAVPSKAHARYKKAFTKQCETEYSDYLAKLKTGETKINVKGMHPHEILKDYLDYDNAEDATIEAQWNTLIQKLKDSGSLSNSLSVVDVSGSMNGIPMNVAITLGLMIATLSSPPFQYQCITFHEDPTFHKMKKEASAHTRIQDMKAMSWGGSTKIEKVFDLILTAALEFKITQEKLPNNLFIFSDMQFDEASGIDSKNYTSFHELMSKKYAEKGYLLPRIIYWNLRGNTCTFPVSANTPGVSLLSGFSAEALKLFMDGQDFTPLSMMEKALAPYEKRVVVAMEDM